MGIQRRNPIFVGRQSGRQATPQHHGWTSIELTDQNYRISSYGSRALAENHGRAIVGDPSGQRPAEPGKILVRRTGLPTHQQEMAVIGGKQNTAIGSDVVNGQVTGRAIDLARLAPQIHCLQSTAVVARSSCKPNLLVRRPGETVDGAVVQRLGNFLSGTVDDNKFYIIARRNVLLKRQVLSVG